jgi:hypothetical protein
MVCSRVNFTFIQTPITFPQSNCTNALSLILGNGTYRVSEGTIHWLQVNFAGLLSVIGRSGISHFTKHPKTILWNVYFIHIRSKGCIKLPD